MNNRERSPSIHITFDPYTLNNGGFGNDDSKENNFLVEYSHSYHQQAQSNGNKANNL